MRRRTLARPVVCTGVGVHTGLPSRLTAEPAPWGTGLVFADTQGHSVPATLAHAVPEPGATVLVGPDARVRTPEHLLAALYAGGITDAWLTLDGPEVPILDGSAAPWWVALAPGPPGPPISPLVATRPFVWEGGDAQLAVWPAAQTALTATIAFPGGPSGSCTVAFPAEFADIASARTFVTAADAHAARAAGRGRGASAENTVVWGPEGPRAPLRMPDEPVRHKLLDFIGDLALLGAPVLGRFCMTRGTHRAHVAGLRAWLEHVQAASG